MQWTLSVHDCLIVWYPRWQCGCIYLKVGGGAECGRVRLKWLPSSLYTSCQKRVCHMMLDARWVLQNSRINSQRYCTFIHTFHCVRPSKQVLHTCLLRHDNTCNLLKFWAGLSLECSHTYTYPPHKVYRPTIKKIENCILTNQSPWNYIWDETFLTTYIF